MKEPLPGDDTDGHPEGVTDHAITIQAAIDEFLRYNPEAEQQCGAARL